MQWCSGLNIYEPRFLLLQAMCIQENLAMENIWNTLRDFDSITGVLAADVNWDGSNELLVTTFGQQLLVYKQGISSLTLNFHFVKLESLLFQQNLAHPVILNLVRATPTSFHDLYMQQDVLILPAMAWQK